MNILSSLLSDMQTLCRINPSLGGRLHLRSVGKDFSIHSTVHHNDGDLKSLFLELALDLHSASRFIWGRCSVNKVWGDVTPFVIQTAAVVPDVKHFFRRRV